LELDGLVKGIEDDFGDSFEDDCWDGIMDVSDDCKYQSACLNQISFQNGSEVGFEDGLQMASYMALM
jgi:hypothetical protein